MPHGPARSAPRDSASSNSASAAWAGRLRAKLIAAGWRELEADREVSRQLGHRRPEITHHYLRVA